METLTAIAAAFGLVIVGLFIGQVCYSTFRLRYRSPKLVKGDANKFEWHIIIPALNEASVIDDTITALASLRPRCHLWVVNDASDDGTEQIIQRRVDEDQWIHLVDRKPPHARTGKSDALNAAYYRILEWRSKQHETTTAMRTIVGVVDADGRLGQKTLDVLAGASGFADLQIGAVQQDVWMHNAFDDRPLPQSSKLANRIASWLLTLQDLEFRAAIAGIQNGRHSTHSVAMGGNGQWTRLATLDEIAADDAERRQVSMGVPWHGALLEDFELGLHVMLSGWRTVFLPGLWVSQEALPTLRPYLRQRTRWTQGTMQCLRYLPRLWNGHYIGPWALLELLYYLLQPWLWIAGTILFPLPLLDVARSFWRSPDQWFAWAMSPEGWMWIAMFWLMALGPLTSWGLTYRAVMADPLKARWRTDEAGDEVLVYDRSDGPRLTRLQAVGYGLAYVWLVQLSYVIAWRALARLVKRQSGWSKTARSAEISSGKAAVIETAAPEHIGRLARVGR